MSTGPVQFGPADSAPRAPFRGKRPQGLRQEGFLRRVFITSVTVSAYVVVFLTALGWVREAISFALGAAIGIGVFAGTAFVVRPTMTPDGDGASARRWFRGKGWLLGVGLLKWAAAGYLIWLVVRWPKAHIGAFLAGAAIVQTILFLKAVGQMIADQGSEMPGHPRSRGRRPFI